MRFFAKKIIIFLSKQCIKSIFIPFRRFQTQKMTVWGIIISAKNPLFKIFTARFFRYEKKILFFIVFSLTIYIMNGKIVAFATVALATKTKRRDENAFFDEKNQYNKPFRGALPRGQAEKRRPLLVPSQLCARNMP